MRLEAAAILYVDDVVDGRTPIVVLLNGASNPDEDQLTEVRYVQDKVHELSGGDSEIPDEAIIWEDRSINTATIMRELARIAGERDLHRIVVVTNDFQLARATLFACTYGKRIGMSVSGLAAEGVITDMYPDRAAEFTTLYDTERMKVVQVKELAEIFLVPYDPHGFIPTWAKSFLESQE